MVFFNYALRKLNAKIVYYGPGLCGKTTNLQWIHDHFEGGQRGKMISLATEGDRTIFFDLLPIDIGTIRGMDVTLQLYTVPGQVHYNSTRQLVLRGADGVVFVADSQRTMRASNTESFENLQENLMLQGIDLKDFPHIIQFNKRDLRDLLSVEDLNESLNIFSTPIFEAIATEGIGVQESLEGIVKLVMRNLREKYEPVASAAGPKPLSPMGAPVPAAFPSSAPAPATPAPKPPEPSPPAGRPDSEAPSFGAASPDPTPNETQAIGQETDFAAFGDEDGIATAVYEADDEEIAAHEAALEQPAAADETPAFAPADDGAAFEPSLDESDHLGGIFTESGDEDATIEADKVAGTPFDVADADTADEMATDPSIRVESEEVEDRFDDEGLTSEAPEETIDDLFESEVPTVKAFMEDVPEVVEAEGEAGEVHTPPSVGREEMTVGPPYDDDHYEDRIEAPGPFAPPPSTPEEPDVSDSSDQARVDREAEAVAAEVRQALGASEDREALASLSGGDAVEINAAIDGLAAPPEVRPVAPPASEAPATSDAADTRDETPPPGVADADDAAARDEESGEADSFIAETEPDAEPAAPTFEVSEPVEPTPDDAPADTPGATETAAAEQPPVEEPTAEPPAVEPAAAEPVVPPPVDEVSRPRSRPIMFGVGDPFSDAEVETPEVVPRSDAISSTRNDIDVTAEGNQLHLQLKGSSAIAEMGQVRALDIEVPVPGQWVGNRKVTLQLRLTLTPAEDEND